MKTQLIMLPQPILVSDEEFKYPNKGKNYWNGSKIVTAGTGNSYSLNSKNIIAGIPELPSIDFSALSEEDCKKIGWVDVNNLLIQHGVGLQDERNKLLFLKGFKVAQSLNEKKFSEEDMINWLRYYQRTAELGFYSTGENHGKSHNEVLQKFLNEDLSQPKVFDVEVEMVEHKDKQTGVIFYLPAIANNSIKVIKVLND